jgi:hypothetical protein
VPAEAETAHVTTFVELAIWVLEDEIGTRYLTRDARGIALILLRVAM